MATLAPRTQSPKQVSEQASQRAKTMINDLFAKFKAIFPAWKASFETQTDYEQAKQIWLETLIAEQITPNQLKHGLVQARQSKSPFLPSVGQFIDWCKTEDYHVFGLPDETEIYARLQKFMAFGMTEMHRFKFCSDAEYWLITELYQRNRTSEWNEKTLKVEAVKALQRMVKRLKSGEILPKPVMTLPPKVEMLSVEQQQRREAELDKMCKLVGVKRGE